MSLEEVRDKNYMITSIPHREKTPVATLRPSTTFAYESMMFVRHGYRHRKYALRCYAHTTCQRR